MLQKQMLKEDKSLVQGLRDGPPTPPGAQSPVVYILGLLCAPALSSSGSSFSAFAHRPMTCLSVSLLPGHSLCATMELGSPEGSYLELLNSDADPLRLYHLYDQTALAGEEEIELNSGGPCSPGPLLAFSGLLLALDSKLEKGAGCPSEPRTAPGPC